MWPKVCAVWVTADANFRASSWQITDWRHRCMIDELSQTFRWKLLHCSACFYVSVTYLLTELSPSSEAVNYAATQELPSILRNPKVHHRVHKTAPLVLWDNIFQTRLLYLFTGTVWALSKNGRATYWTAAVQFPTGAGFGNVLKACPKGMNSLRPLEHWGSGFKSLSRHGCMCIFILCLCCSVV
jgi:hypothetical protein